MLQNAYFLAKIGADTAENEQHFAAILPIGRRVADRCRGLLLVLELVVVIEHLLVAEHGSAVRRNEVASGLCLF